MARRAGLRAKIERLEQRRQRPTLPRFILALNPTELAGEIVGYAANNVTFLRLDNEPIEACRERAKAASDAPFLIALYSREGVYSATSTAEAPQTAAPEARSDPHALANVGRVAGREELWRIGAIPGPPERPR